MKRWALLLVLFASPLSSPLACGGDNCLRTSDCHADQICSAGKCVLEDPPDSGSGGEGVGGEDSTPVTAGTKATAGSGGTAGSSSAGKPSTDGGETTTPSGGEGNTDIGGAGGESAAASGGDGGLGGAIDLSVGGAL